MSYYTLVKLNDLNKDFHLVRFWIHVQEVSHNAMPHDFLTQYFSANATQIKSIQIIVIFYSNP